MKLNNNTMKTNQDNTPKTLQEVKILPTVSLQDGDTVFYNDSGTKIIHKDGTFDIVPFNALSLDEAIDAHFKIGKDDPIGSRNRAMYEEKKDYST